MNLNHWLNKTIMTKFRLFVLFFLAISFFAFISCQQAEQNNPKAKYVFFFIGDGMGISQVMATEEFQSSMTGEGNHIPLGFREFPGAGLSTTHAANRFITGSAAAGTALATGHKTNIGRISMDTSGTVPFETIAEKAKKKGMKVGIISNVSIDHATPAVFYAHQPNRGMYFEIGLDLAASNIDFFGGGGFRKPEGEFEGDKIKIIELAQQNGFEYINTKAAFEALTPSDHKVLFVNPGLTGGEAMLYAIDQPEGYISLADITKKAIELLDNENGFFMMVEGGKIDWVCHANDAATTVYEVLDFSAAVDVAVSFYKQHPDETLIVVTADHETGGLGLGSNVMKYESDYSLLAHQKVSGDAFNNILSDWRKDNHINEKGFKKMLMLLEENFGFGGEEAPIALSRGEKETLKKAFMAYDLSQESEYGNYNRLTYVATEILAHRAGLGWTTYSHTGVAVPVYTIGVYSTAFSGNIDNTDIPKLIWETIE